MKEITQKLNEADFEAALTVAWKAGAALRTRMDAAYNLGIQRGKEEARVALAAPAVPELSRADIETFWRAHAPADIVDWGVQYADGGATRWLVELAKAMSARPAVPEGYKLLKDTTGQDRDWPDDFLGENGNYYSTCGNCLRQFVGHKRRVTCRSCAAAGEGAD